MSKIQLLNDVVTDLRNLADSITALTEAVYGEPPCENKSDTSESVSSVTLEDVRSTLVQLSRNGYTAQVQVLIRNHGATRLSDIPESEYVSILEEAGVITDGS